MTNSIQQMIQSGIFSVCDIEWENHSKKQTFHCIQPLRIFPKRRLTMLSELSEENDKQYVIKIFSQQRRATSEYKKEIDGYNCLHKKQYAVPKRINYGQANQGVWMIVYEYIANAPTLDTVFSVIDRSLINLPLIRQLMTLIAHLHGDGLLHTDPGLQNFLLKQNKIIILDFSAIKKTNNHCQWQDNLSQLIAQLPMTWNIETGCIKAYLSAAGIPFDQILHKQLSLSIVRCQQQRERQFLKKIFRQCTQFEVQIDVQKKIIIDTGYLSQSLLATIANPQAIFHAPSVQILKDGRSSTVGSIVIASRRYVVKRYNARCGNYWKLLAGQSRASRSWRNAHRLCLRGIPTAKPVAMLECRSGEYKGLSLFVMEYQSGVRCDDYFRQVITKNRHQQVAEKILSLLVELKRQQLLHKDLKAGNFIINDHEPILIDLDSMIVEKNHHRLQQGWKKALKRFCENWIDQPELQHLFDQLIKQCNILE